MPRGLHRATPGPRRRPARRHHRVVVAAALGALAVAALSSGAAPAVEAEQPVTFDAADAADLLADRAEATAARGEDRAPVALVERELGEASAAPLPEPTGQLYAVDAVNVRSAPSLDGERLSTLAWAEAVDVTGETSDGWTQVIWDEQLAWVSSDYLAETEPEPEPEPAEESAPGVSSAACATSPEIEQSLQANAAAAYRAVCAAFPGVVSAYGGYRAGDGGDHGSGQALDIMVSGSAGWDVVAYLQAHAGELGITYLIYEQLMWMAGSGADAWEFMADRGSPTANHYDHVHVSTS